MTSREDKPPDEDRIVALPASECHRPVAEVTALDEHERCERALGARAARYLHIFASRRVEAPLRPRPAH